MSLPPSDGSSRVFGDDVVAAAMIDRLVHHAEVVRLKGDSYRLKNGDLGRVPAATVEPDINRTRRNDAWGSICECREGVSFPCR
jgi:hypothetical protein